MTSSTSRRAVVAGLLAVGLLALAGRALLGHTKGTPASRSAGRLSLTPCRLDGVTEEVRCATLEVPEDRAAPGGKKIGLRIAVIPALAADPEPDPLFILAGGPGQAAVTLAGLAAPMFEKVHRSRDLVFVDQRGTGKSNGLHCEASEDAGLAERLDVGIDRPGLQACLARYRSEGTDVRAYLTPQAMDDLDEVRAALGYDRIDLWGASYGTRAALVYLRQHPEHVRAAILDSVAPATDSLMLTAAQDGQRALDLIFDACARIPSCGKTYPDLKAQFTALLARLGEHPAHVRVPHPLTGVMTDLTISRDAFLLSLHGLLYSSDVAALLPLIVHRASEGDFAPFAAQAITVAGGLGANLDQGMFFSVVCAEDGPAATAEARAKVNGPETYFGDSFAKQILDACELWPRGELPPGYHDLVRSDAPVLLLEGELDPITPPQRAEEARAGLPHGVLVVVPGVGHGVTQQGCVPELVARFLELGNADTLDAGCAQQLGRPPFFESFAGPTP